MRKKSSSVFSGSMELVGAISRTHGTVLSAWWLPRAMYHPSAIVNVHPKGLVSLLWKQSMGDVHSAERTEDPGDPCGAPSATEHPPADPVSS